MFTFPRTPAAAIALGACALLGACGSTGYQRADAVSDSLSTTNTRLDEDAQQVDAVLGSLDSVVAAKNGDLRSAYKNFDSQVSSMESAASAAQSAADKARSNADAHFEAWTKEGDTISDPNLKKASQSRRDAAKASFDALTQQSDKLKASSDQFLADLRDIRTFLGTDLTTHGVDAVADTVKKAHADGASLKAAMSAVKSAASAAQAQLVSQSSASK